jgi:hypothetical protein
MRSERLTPAPHNYGRTGLRLFIYYCNSMGTFISCYVFALLSSPGFCNVLAVLPLVKGYIEEDASHHLPRISHTNNQS